MLWWFLKMLFLYRLCNRNYCPANYSGGNDLNIDECDADDLCQFNDYLEQCSCGLGTIKNLYIIWCVIGATLVCLELCKGYYVCDLYHLRDHQMVFLSDAYLITTSGHLARFGACILIVTAPCGAYAHDIPVNNLFNIPMEK